MRKGFTPLEAVGQPVRNKRLLSGFTLLETMIALAIFALASIGVGGAIVSVQQSWQKQKASVNLINSVRWGMEFMANEIRRGATVVKTTAASDGTDEGIKFRLPGAVSDYVFYWRGNGGVFGDASIIFRGVGPTLSTANSSSQELVNLIDGSSPIFSVSGNLVTIDFTVKKGNNSFRLKTAARSRNRVNANAVGLWHFEETGTTLYDATVNANNATASGTTLVNGTFGQARDFNGVDDYAYVGNPSTLNNIVPITISAWIYPRSAGEGGGGRIISKNAINWGDVGFWSFTIDNTAPEVNAFTFYKEGDTDLKRSTADNTVSFNTWQYIVVTWDGSTSASNVHIYKNGVELPYNVTKNETGTSRADDTQPLIIGNQQNGAATFDGIIDEVAVFNRVLSADEMAEGQVSSFQ